MSKNKKWLSSVALLLTVVLSGCNTEENSSGDAKAKDQKFTIGISQYVEHPSLDEATKGFKKAIKDAGLNVKYDEQNAQNDQNNSQTIATNLVGEKVDLIFANATPSALSVANATKDIPIIFTSVTDPIGAKLVENMDEPEGNITGTTDSHPDAIAKTTKLITEQMGIKKVGTIYNSGEQNSEVQVKALEKELDKQGAKLKKVSVATSSEVKQAAESLVGKVDGLVIVTDNTVVSALESVIQVAEKEDLPLFVGELDSVKRGGFAAYGFNYYDIGYQAGEQAVKILKEGKKIKELPVEPPKDLKLLINKKAAKEMNVDLKKISEKAEFTE